MLVTLCGVLPSRNSQRTLSPRWMRTVGLLILMLRRTTDVVAASATDREIVRMASVDAARNLITLGVLASLAAGSLAACGDARHAAGRPAPAAPRALRYAVVGDSYSNGEGVGIERSWPAQLAARLRRAGVPFAVVANPATSGWTSAQARALELPVFAAARPQVATLQIGVNDWVQGVPASTFRSNLRALLDGMLRTLHAPRRLLVVTIPDFSVTPSGAAYTGGRDATAGIAAFNAVIRAECRARGVAVADVFAVSRAMGRPGLTAPDGLHPSARELARWTDRIAPIARRLWSALSIRS